MSVVARAALLIIGSELLNGEIRDTNLFTLARALTRLGFTVQQAAMVRDDSFAIAASLVTLLETAPQVLLISGGLGPTEDDGTLQAVALALHRPLEESPAARALVEAHYDRLLAAGYVPQRGPESARRKMAQLPAGALPLPNPIGVAPGVTLEAGETLIVCLPGVPAELEAIFETAVVPLLMDRFQPLCWVERALVAHCEDEAQVAALLQTLAARFPEVYLKSLARPFPDAGSAALRIIAAMHAPNQTIAAQSLDAVLAALQQALAEAGIPILDEAADLSAPGSAFNC